MFNVCFCGGISGGHGHTEEADESVLYDVSALSHQRQHSCQGAGKATLWVLK